MQVSELNVLGSPLGEPGVLFFRGHLLASSILSCVSHSSDLRRAPEHVDVRRPGLPPAVWVPCASALASLGLSYLI